MTSVITNELATPLQIPSASQPTRSESANTRLGSRREILCWDESTSDRDEKERLAPDPALQLLNVCGGVVPNKLGKQLLRCAPYFPVADVEESAAYYERVLGFRREYAAGAPAQFAILSRDGLGIMLRLVATPERISPNQNQGGTWDAFFWVRDVRALHAELLRAGAMIVYGPVIQEAYQMEEFAVRDRDGHVLGFGQKLASPHSPRCE